MASAAVQILRARRNGIKIPLIAYNEARRAGLEFAVLCAVLEQESAGGENVFGHDAVRNPVKGGPVTKKRYLEYKRYRQQGLGMQGVGPMQLTYYAYQDLADRLGGAWNPKYNVRVGANILTKAIRRNGLYPTLRAYNGSDAYARQVMARVVKWRKILHG
jgi:soluble lytic murein transglycosylase-like protein